MSKQLKPEYSTVVAPSEYDIDKQMKEWLRLANHCCAASQNIDVGKVWGLYEGWRKAREIIEVMRDGIHVGEYDLCLFCNFVDGKHDDECVVGLWLKENTVFSEEGGEL